MFAVNKSFFDLLQNEMQVLKLTLSEEGKKLHDYE